MKQKIEAKMHEYVESLLAKPQLNCDEYLILKTLHRELQTEERVLREAEARARKMNNLFNLKGETNEL